MVDNHTATNQASLAAGLDEVGWNARYRQALQAQGWDIFPEEHSRGLQSSEWLTAPLAFGPIDGWERDAIIARIDS